MAQGRSSLFDLTFNTEALRALKQQLEAQFLTAARAAVGEAGRRVERELETAFESAGAGKLARAWNTQVFPKRTTVLADAPTAVISGRGKDRTRGALLAFARGARIKSTDGMIAIPLKAAGRRAGRQSVGFGPREWERRTGLKLEPAKIKGKLYLVTQGVRSKARGTVLVAATRRRLDAGRATERLLVFLLVDQVEQQARVNVDPIFARGPRYLDDIFTQKINELISRAGQGPPAAG